MQGNEYDWGFDDVSPSDEELNLYGTFNKNIRILEKTEWEFGSHVPAFKQEVTYAVVGSRSNDAYFLYLKNLNIEFENGMVQCWSNDY